jgi:hypothetical protein
MKTSSSSFDSISSRLHELLGINVSSAELQEVANTSITLPQLKYGYRTTPATWSELVTIIQIENDLAKLSRSERQQRDYELFRYYSRRQYHSVVDYILCTKFGYEKEKEDNGLWRAGQPSVTRVVQTAVVPNDFPYSMERGVVHYILWKTKEDIAQEDIDQAKIELKHRLGNVVDIILWVNPPHLQSLPEIDHVHFLCLFEPKPQEDEI